MVNAFLDFLHKDIRLLIHRLEDNSLALSCCTSCCDVEMSSR